MGEVNKDKDENKAPAVRLERQWTRRDVVDFVSGEVSRALGEEMRANEDRFRQVRGLRGDAPIEITPMQIQQSNMLQRRSTAGLDNGLGIKTAAFMGWMNRARGDVERAYKMARAARIDKRMSFNGVNYGAEVLRALGESTMAGGGAFVPENISADFIELLYAASVVLAAGPRKLSVANGNLTIPGGATGATGGWVGESANITKGEQTTRQVRLDLKKLAVLTPFSNELGDDSSPAIDAFIRDDLLNYIEVALDETLLRGTGSAFTPAGFKPLISEAAPDHKFNSNTTPTVATITTELYKQLRLLADAKIKQRNTWRFMSPRSAFHLMSLRDGNNNLVFAADMDGGRLAGAKWAMTQNIQDTLGSGDKSEVYCMEMNEVLFGADPKGVQYEVRDGVAYHDGSNVLSAFSRDESVARVKIRVDQQLRHGGKEGVLLEDVNWGV